MMHVMYLKSKVNNQLNHKTEDVSSDRGGKHYTTILDSVNPKLHSPGTLQHNGVLQSDPHGHG